MLGFFGFLVAAILISTFVWSAQKAYTTVEPARLKALCVGFGLLALAMVLWGIITVTNNPASMESFMLAADVLLFLGTASMLGALLGNASVPLLSLLGGLVAIMTSYRAFVRPPTAFVRDGLLHFNLQGSSRYLFVGVFALIWLPAMMVVANRIADNPLLAARRYSLQAYFALLVVLMGIFIKAQRNGAIIGLFAAIAFVFLLITIFNVTLAKAQQAAASVPREKQKGRVRDAAN